MRTMDFKAAVLGAGDGDLEDGEIIALVSVFNNIDSYGDVVVPGAFAKSLAEWETRGDPIPFIWAHDWADPFSHVGIVRSAQETDAGLRVRAYISPDERAANPKADQVYRLLKNRRVTQFSFAFDVKDGGFGEREDREVYELRELKIHEVGPCLLGVNQETELIAAKAARLQKLENLDTAGRKAVHNLTAAKDAIEAVLANVLAKAQDETDSAAPDAEERRNEPGSTNAEKASACGTAVSPATASLLADLAMQDD